MCPVQRAGILGIGTYLPEEVRRNDWWPAEVVDAWMAARRGPPPLPPVPTVGMARVIAAMTQQAYDPFQGVTERRVMPTSMKSVDMEVMAAEQAIARAGIDRREIGAVLTHSAVPEYLLSNSASLLHHRLGLPADCFSMQAEASGFSFMMQLGIAEQMIALGRARYVLCTQSCASSRLIDQNDPHSPLLGDGASAVIVGPVADGGVLASVYRTDGALPRALVASVPGGRWYDPGQVVLHRADPGHAIQTFLETADRAKEAVDAVLARLDLLPTDVDFFGSHQGTPWLRQVIQDVTGLTNARAVDVFATTGYMVAVSIPLVLALALQEGQLRAGDLVVLFGGGVGSTYGASVLRWGDAR